jgi:hypothetical protein
MKNIIYIIAFLFAAASPVLAQKPKDLSQQRTRLPGLAAPSIPPMQSKQFSQAQMLQFFRDLHAKAAGWKTEIDPLAPSWQDNYIAGQAVQANLKGTKKDFDAILFLTSSSPLKTICGPPRGSPCDLYYEYNLLQSLIGADEDLNALADEATEDANLQHRLMRLYELDNAVRYSREELNLEISLRIEELAYPPQTKKAANRSGKNQSKKPTKRR